MRWYNVLDVRVDAICKQDQTLHWTRVAGAHLQCVNSRYTKFKYIRTKSDYTLISQCNLQ